MASADVLKVAVPLMRVPVPSVVAPSLKVTVPVGVPVAGAVAETVAVNVTDWPDTDGFAELTATVVLPPLFTVWLRVEDVLVAKLVEPPYEALIEWLPTARADVENTAEPELRDAVPSVFAPSLNVTVPVGVPEPGATAATVAVKLTGWPKTDGFAEETIAVVVPAVFTTWLRVDDVLALKLLEPP